MARGRFLLGLASGVILTGGLAAGGLYAFGGVIAPLLLGAPTIPKTPTATASEASRAAMAEAEALVAADDRADFADAERGFIATIPDATVLTAERLGQETLRGLLGSVEQAKKSPKPGRKGSGGRSRARSKPREDEGAASGEGDEQRSAAGGRILRAQWIA